MIAKLKSNKSLQQTLHYNLKADSELIAHYNLNGDSIKDFELEMKLTQNCFKGRAKNQTLHCILSPTIEDGRQLSIEKWNEIAQDYVDRLGLTDHQRINFLHVDKNHYHLHLVINKVSDTTHKVWYSKINDLKLSHKIGHELALKFGLKSAKNTSKVKALKNKNLSKNLGTTQYLNQTLSKIEASNIEDFFSEIKRHGIMVKTFINPNSKILTGYGLEKDGTFITHKKLEQQFRLKNLLEKFTKSKSIDQKVKASDVNYQLDYVDEKVKQEFTSEIRNIKFVDVLSFFVELEKIGFRVIIHRDKATNKTRGYAVEKKGVIINASDLGKEFTLKSLSLMNNLNKLEKKSKKIKN